MLKKKMVVLVTVFCLCFLGGCADREKAESSSKVTENLEVNHADEFPKHMAKILPSGVEVAADIDIPELDTREVSIYQGIPLEIDTKKMSRVLLSDQVTQHTEENGQGDESESLCTYTDENGAEIISIADKWVKFSTAKFAHIRTDFETEVISERQKDFDFIDRKKADSEIKEILGSLGIDVYSKYECISMDYMTLEEKNLEQYAGLEDVTEFQDDINILKAIPWSEEYDCYCFTYYGIVDGLKLDSQDRETNDNVVPGSIIRAVYSKDGIQSLEISNIYVAQKEVEKKTLCIMDTVLSAIDRKYNSIILQGDYKVNAMELEYIADFRENGKGYLLLPVWKCSISHNYDTQNKNSSEIINTEDNFVIYIDAISGTEIYSGGNI